jgi:putative alpha-1,2-mannosidase
MPIFPAWASYTVTMIGDHVSTMISDAYIKGIKNFDIEKAYRYMRQNAFDTPAREDYVDGKGSNLLFQISE